MVIDETTDEMKWKVYVHISPSGKKYVGITSQKLNDRWRNGKGYVGCVLFYNAIKKYGWDTFEHEIIASNLTEQEAKNFERLLIDKLRTTDRKYGYNISAGGDGVSGIHHSDEVKKRMSEAKHSEHVLQYDLNMNFIKEFHGIKEASRKTGINRLQISRCCRNIDGNITAGGYIWIFQKDKESINKDEYIKRLMHDKIPKAVCQFSLKMEFIDKYESIAEAGRLCNISASAISNAASGKHQHVGGFIWILSSDYKKMLNGDIPMREPCIDNRCKSVIQYSYDMELIKEYSSKVEAGNAIGVSPRTIGHACNSKSGKCAGFIWKYKEVPKIGISREK